MFHLLGTGNEALPIPHWIDARPAPPKKRRHPREKLSMVKCDRCRRDKQKCLPVNREWPQKCNRCQEKDFDCSENTRKERIKRMKPNCPAFQTVEVEALEQQLVAWPETCPDSVEVDVGHDSCLERRLSNHELACAVAFLKMFCATDSAYITGVIKTTENLFRSLHQVRITINHQARGLFAWIMCFAEALTDEIERIIIHIPSISHAYNMNQFSCPTITEVARYAADISACVETSYSAFRTLMKYSLDLTEDDACFNVVLDLENRLQRLRPLIRSKLQDGLADLFLASISSGSGPHNLCGQTLRSLSDNSNSLHNLLYTLIQKLDVVTPVGLGICPLNSSIGEGIKHEMVQRNPLYTISTIGLLGQTFLHYPQALNTGNLSEFEKLPADTLRQMFERPDVFGRTPLHLALELDKADWVDMFISRGWNVQASTGWNSTPLHYAAVLGSHDVCARLLSTHGVVPNHTDARGDTPLHHAVINAHVSVYQELLSHSPEDHQHGTPLHIAVSNGNVGICKALIAVRRGKTKICEALLSDAQVNPNLKNNDGDTPLHIAARYNSGACKTLLSHPQIDPNSKNKAEDTPLHIAIKYGNTDACKVLIHARVDPNLRNKEEDTPLHIAGRCGNAGICKELLSHAQIDPCLKNNHGYTPLHIAARCGNTEICEALLSHTQDDLNPKDKNGDTPLHIAVRYNVSVCRMLLSHPQVDPNSKNNDEDTPLHIAGRCGNADAGEALLSHPKVEPYLKNNNADTFLHVAARRGNTEICKTVLSRTQVDPNLQNDGGDTPLHIAARYSADVCTTLLSYTRVDPNAMNSNMDTPLHVAIGYSNTDACKALLLHDRVDPNSRNKGEDTPLHIAVRRRNADVCEGLLSLPQIDPNLKNDKEDTPLHIAVRWGSADIRKTLLEHPLIKPNAAGLDAQTPLHIGASHGSADACRQLLTHPGININSKDQSASTPLHIAAESGHIAVCQLLLFSEFINANEEDYAGKTPLQLAIENRRKNVVTTILEQHTFPHGSDQSTSEIQLAAIKSKDLEIIELVFREAPAINPKYYETMFEAAVETGQQPIGDYIRSKMDRSGKFSGR